MRLNYILLMILMGAAHCFAQDNETKTLTVSQSNIDQEDVNDSLISLQEEKLIQEIEKLKIENSVKSIHRLLPTYAGLITAFVAVVGAIFSFLRFLREKHEETNQKKEENQIRLESKFNSIVKDLGSENSSLLASSLVSILTYLKPEYKDFHKQVYLILLAILKARYTSESSKLNNVSLLLVKTFEQALRVNIDSINIDRTTSDQIRTFDLDFSRMNLYRIDLHGLDLHDVDFAFADLSYANLENCNLRQARGIEANFSGARFSRSNLNEARFNKANFEKAKFHQANLVSAKMKDANLSFAEFQQASMQETNLNEANINNARFEYANLNNTFFRGIKYKNADLISILKSKESSWKKANFDEEVKIKLENLIQSK